MGMEHIIMTDRYEVLRGMKDYIRLIDDEVMLKAYTIAIKQRMRAAQKIDKVCFINS